MYRLGFDFPKSVNSISIKFTAETCGAWNIGTKQFVLMSEIGISSVGVSHNMVMLIFLFSLNFIWSVWIFSELISMQRIQGVGIKK